MSSSPVRFVFSTGVRPGETGFGVDGLVFFGGEVGMLRRMSDTLASLESIECKRGTLD